MIKKLLSYAKGYGIYAFLSPLAIVFEVLIEVAIPFLMWFSACVRTDFGT